MKKFIGVDIGGTKIAVVRGDESGKIEDKIFFENNASPEAMIEKILMSVKQLGTADAIGVSCGGPLDVKKGLILSPPNLPGWDRVPIVSILEKATAIPTYLQNDADACALAEWKYGAGQGCEHMIFLTFGTGMGAGLILNGALYTGSNGYAGEIGHIALEKDGPIGYGKHGSVEGFCSGGGIRQLAISYAEERFSQGLSVSFCQSQNELSLITAKTVADRAFEGHNDAIAVYEHCGEQLGRGLAILVDLLNPQKIVIGSIYVRANALLRDAMMRTLAKEALPGAFSACEILPAKLGESLGDVAAISVAKNGYERRGHHV
ncbi:MAG: ROK family protein [Oscillospiraceae bacterium]|nr:ROK family protein [Oscillospiraceae bacterium]